MFKQTMKLLVLTVFVVGSASPLSAQERAAGSQVVQPNRHRVILHTETVIDAPVEQVWKTATNFAEMTSWSPIFKKLNGELKDGAKVVAIYDAGGKPFKNTVTLTWVDGQRFGWKGSTIYGPQFHDNHMFLFVPTDDGKTLFMHTDDFTDVSHKADLSKLASQVLASFEIYNAALKKRVETGD